MEAQPTGHSLLPSTTTTTTITRTTIDTTRKMKGKTCTIVADTAAEQHPRIRLRQRQQQRQQQQQPEHHQHASLVFPRSTTTMKRRMVTTEKNFNVRVPSLVLLLSFVIVLQFHPSCIGASSSTSSSSRIANVNKKSNQCNKFDSSPKTILTKNLFPKTLSLLGNGSGRTPKIILGGSDGGLSSILDNFPRGGGDSDGDGGDTDSTKTKNKKGGKSSKKKTTKSSSSSSSGGSSNKKTKSKKKTTKSETTARSSSGSSDSTKKAIDKAMQENKDAAQAMGDAIRERADLVREIKPLSDRYGGDPFLQAIDRSVSSVGWAMGASDVIAAKEILIDDEGGGVHAPPSSVIANYFLKSHGGAHLFQSICSVMAVTASFGAFVAMGKTSPKWTLIFFRRALIFAMIKHLAGLLSSAVIAAKAVPRIGLSKTRDWMEKVARDPVSHYIFYSALLLLWLPSNSLVVATAKTASKGAAAAGGAATSTVASKGASTTWWWPKQAGWLIPTVLAPILLREVISTLLVISDVMILWSASDENVTFDWILSSSQSAVNAVMSLLVSPTKWRSADPSERQAILASLVSKVSLAFEAAVGAVLFFDVLIGFFQLAFGVPGGAGQRPSFQSMLVKTGLMRLYVHYMLHVRRSKYAKLAATVRGGAAQVPFWIMNSLMNPAKAMGINLDGGDKDPNSDVVGEMSMLECFRVGFGLEDDETGKKKA